MYVCSDLYVENNSFFVLSDSITPYFCTIFAKRKKEGYPEKLKSKKKKKTGRWDWNFEVAIFEEQKHSETESPLSKAWGSIMFFFSFDGVELPFKSPPFAPKLN